MRRGREKSGVARRFSPIAAAILGLAAAVTTAIPARADDAQAAAAADLEEADRLEQQIESLADRGMPARALPLAEQALALREKRLGPNDPKVAGALGDLGALAFANGDPLRAEPLLERAYTILKSAPSAPPRIMGITLANLAAIARGRADYNEARARSEVAVAALEKAGAEGEGDLPSALRGLAISLNALGRRRDALAVYARALEISRRLGKSSIAVLILTDLGSLERADGRAPEAAAHFNEALDLANKSLGPDHPIVGNLLHRIGRFYHFEGNYPEADRYYQRASPILEEAYGPNSPTMADLLADWSLLREAMLDIPGAVDLRSRANEIEQTYADLLIATGSEADRQRYSAKLRRHLEDTIWLHAGRGQDDRGALRLAFTTLVRMKGRVLDALASDVATLRDHLGPEEQGLLDDLGKVRADLSALYVRGPESDPKGYAAERKRLVAEEARIEDAMGARSAEIRAASAKVTIEAVQAALPEGAALVEMIRFQPHDARAYSEIGSTLGEPRYIAYVLKRTGDPTFTRILPKAGEVDHVVETIRARIQTPSQNRVYEAADRFDFFFMRRVNELLGDTRKVILSPDGDLGILPFGALIEDGHFLIERFTYTYLTSGRDLIRLAASKPGAHRGAPQIFANPSYDKAGAAPPIAAAGGRGAGRSPAPYWRKSQDREGEREAVDPNLMGFPGLPGTEVEAKAIRGVVPGAVLHLGADADEGTLKALSGPLFLHVATHGFFFGSLEHAEPEVNKRERIEDPLVRSGVALAGANLHGRSGEDGILTALEASTLDLHGTELVVLSACETGLGDIENGDAARRRGGPFVSQGDGVRGLRRALVLAGAETQVMSLWKVDDDATRALMTTFYTKLFRDGVGRSEALREAQLALLRNKSTAHPFFWAAFIASGASGPMSRDARWMQPPKVDPGPRGCSCEAVGLEGSGAAGAWALGGLLLAMRRRRRACASARGELVAKGVALREEAGQPSGVEEEDARPRELSAREIP